MTMTVTVAEYKADGEVYPVSIEGEMGSKGYEYEAWLMKEDGEIVSAFDSGVGREGDPLTEGEAKAALAELLDDSRAAKWDLYFPYQNIRGGRYPAGDIKRRCPDSDYPTGWTKEWESGPDEWSEADALLSVKQGWQIAPCGNDVQQRYQLQRVDDPLAASEYWGPLPYRRPKFQSDDTAVAFVKRQAKQGDALAQKAIRWLIRHLSTDVEDYTLAEALSE